uniref:receptor protein-tyrosine kinase n=1 Tax=Caenorhabditis japonica TaxID=281687 RepID=A0A8R1DQ75_CAEJA
MENRGKPLNTVTILANAIWTLCTLSFMRHFTQQSSSSKLAVRVHLESGQVQTLYEYSRGSPKAFSWIHVSVKMGSYSQPFRISIDCETGSSPKRKKQKSKEPWDDNDRTRPPFACGLANIQFDNCADIRDPLGKCSRGNQFLCSTDKNTRCLNDAQCDMKEDCEDGSDEMGCDDHKVLGSQCNFNNGRFCEGWEQVTRISDPMESQFEPTTKAPINAIGETPIWLLRIKSPSSRFAIQKEARKGAGSFLVYQSEEARKLSRRTSALVSSAFPRTNPIAYDKNSKYFETCKLRFYVCAKTYATTWHISIISKVKYPLDSGRISLYESRAFELSQLIQSPVCEWERILVKVPRQNGKFKLGIFVEHRYDRDDFFAIDDLSFSPSCFEKDVNESTWQIPNLLISTCGTTGFERPANCDQYRALDGQTDHFLKEDGTQEWTVPNTGFYLIEACGAAGGSIDKKDGDKGECLTLQVHLIENLALRMLIGHMGESPCITEQDDELRPASCAATSHPMRSRDAGAGGGGATLITVEANLWNVVVGGGAGASWGNDDIFGGYGASVIPVDIDGYCKRVCRSISHTDFQVDKNEHQCPDQKKNQSTVLGGFGGGGNTCGMIGGSGAGYLAGNPFGIGRERSGSSNVTANFSKEVEYYQAKKVGDGFIKISFCRKQCSPPSVCRFRKDEEYCGCPDGTEFTNSTDSCSCPLHCPSGASCQYRNFTSEPFCMCNNGKHIDDFDVDFCALRRIMGIGKLVVV